MRISPQIRRARRLSLTSLIDVIFLLLLFFMLSSTFTRFAQVKINVGTGGGAVGTRPDVVVSLGEASWSLNGDAVTAETMGANLAPLRQNGGTRAVVLVSPDVASQDLVDALEILRKANFSASVAR